MKVLVAIVASLLIAAPALAQRKDCEELKSEIDAKIRKNGIEFQSSSPIPEWTEMTVEVKTSMPGRSMRCTGVVVACAGGPKAGYRVALLFTGLSRLSRAQLDAMTVPAGR